MIEKDKKVVLKNRGIREFGTVTKRWRRKEVWYHNVKTERGVELEAITVDPKMPCYIDYELSTKLGK